MTDTSRESGEKPSVADLIHRHAGSMDARAWDVLNRVFPDSPNTIDDKETSVIDVPTTVSDRFAITDVVNRYAELMDAKAWDDFAEVFAADTVARRGPAIMEGAATIVAAMRQHVGSPEIKTQHFVGNFTPRIDGDGATASVPVRAMHAGTGRRAGLHYEVQGNQFTTFRRTADGWRITEYTWDLVVALGDASALFAEREGEE
ncbi:nuclear transport factor 2 family protein [Nocardia pseudovaccinii]|uniref:nuclear transport factor 2 family protein n=1 Tax=Nocardia pseudovaccinii TaxID=189540 RepID=UPI003D90AC58